jgi:hypothetical protein
VYEEDEGKIEYLQGPIKYVAMRELSRTFFAMYCLCS